MIFTCTSILNALHFLPKLLAKLTNTRIETKELQILRTKQCMASSLQAAPIQIGIDIKTIEVHYLRKCGAKVSNEIFLVIVAGIDFR